MSTPRDVDADFLALPLDALADAALQVARAAGATYAAVRVQQVRETVVRVRDRAVEGTSDVTDAGLSVRVVLDGAWGFAATGRLDPDAAARTAALAAAQRPGRPPARAAPGRARPGRRPAGDVGVLATTSTRSTCLPTSRAPCCSGWGEQVLAAGAAHAEAESWCVKEQKFYADLDGSRTVQQRVRMHPGVTAVVVADDGRVDTVRSPGPAGRARLGAHGRPGRPAGRGGARPGRGRPREARRPVGRARPLRPGHRAQPAVADHPRVGRPRHRAGPGARLRGRLRRHLVRHPRRAGHAPLRQRAHARHRRPGRRARAVHGGLGRRGRARPDAGTSSATASTSATSWTGPWPRSGARRPTAAPTPTRRSTPRSSGCPTSAWPPTRTAPTSTAWSRGRGRDPRPRRPVVVDRHAAVQLPVHRPDVPPDPGRAGRRDAPRRRLPGQHARLLVPAGRRRRAVDVVAGGRAQLRQGPARAGRPGEPRLPRGRRLPGRPSSTPSRRAHERRQTSTAPRRVEQLVDAALAAGGRHGADDVVVVVAPQRRHQPALGREPADHDGHDVARRRSASSWSATSSRAAPTAASPARSAGTEDVERLVADAAAAAARAEAAEDAAAAARRARVGRLRRRAGRGLARAAGRHRPRPRRAVRRLAGRRAGDVRLRRAPGRRPRGPRRAPAPGTARSSRSAPSSSTARATAGPARRGRAPARATSPTSTSHALAAEVVQGLDWQATPGRRGARPAPCRCCSPSASADLFGEWLFSADARTAADGPRRVRPPRRRDPGRRAAHRRPAHRPRRPPPPGARHLRRGVGHEHGRVRLGVRLRPARARHPVPRRRRARRRWSPAGTPRAWPGSRSRRGRATCSSSSTAAPAAPPTSWPGWATGCCSPASGTSARSTSRPCS